MRKLFPLLAIVLVGCQQEVQPDGLEENVVPPKPTAQKGVAPIGSGAVGGLSPVSGSENLGGGTGGGIASAAKDRARGAAAQAGAGSSAQNGETGE
ncbi:MAG: hypothetical protein ACAH95_10340 [Fimbriimonas sp.]